MATLKEEAMVYEPQTTMNIADLNEVPIDIELKDGEGKDEKGETYTYKFAELNDKHYRVPNVVIGELKKILKLKPSVTKVRVIKKGSGLATRYEVEALD